MLATHCQETCSCKIHLSRLIGGFFYSFVTVNCVPVHYGQSSCKWSVGSLRWLPGRAHMPPVSLIWRVIRFILCIIRRNPPKSCSTRAKLFGKLFLCINFNWGDRQHSLQPSPTSPLLEHGADTSRRETAREAWKWRLWTRPEARHLQFCLHNTCLRKLKQPLMFIQARRLS